jgi:ABC-2 type transport system ATP-binding protein
MNASAAVIACSGLSRAFGAVRAVDGVDLVVPPLAVYGFLGANGAGKTTTIRMVVGLIRPDAGSVALFGRPLAADRRALLARVGALVEVPSLYPHLTGRENLRITARLRGASAAQIDRALGIVRLTADAGRLVRGYSHGMRQRLGLALALLGEPELLVLDEPTNGLDPAGIREVREQVRSLPTEHGVTVFISSHLLSEVEQIATHLGIIHRGRMLFQGSLAALQAERQPRIVAEVSDAARASAALAARGWPASVEGGRIVVARPGLTPSEAAAVNAVLVGERIDVSYLSLERLSLEAMFLSLTKEQAA